MLGASTLPAKGSVGYTDHVLLRADTFDDRHVQIRIILLPAGLFVVGMHVDDGGTRPSARDTLCDDVLDRDRDARLPVA
jgi:hypothetical protein